MLYVDTNIFIRYLTRDDPVKADACKSLFEKAQANTITLGTTEAIIAEVVYILSSKKTYNLPRVRIRALFYPLLSLPGLKLPHRQRYLAALNLYVTLPILDFEDALLVTSMRATGATQVASYDQGLDRVEEIERIEP